jgi:glutathione S-transferase
MDWQSVDLTNALRAAFLGLVAKSPVPGGDDAIQASLREWPKKMQMVEEQLKKAGGYIAGPGFTLADVPIGLTVNRWFAAPIPIERPNLPAVADYYERLSQRPAFLAHGRNGTP